MSRALLKPCDCVVLLRLMSRSKLVLSESTRKARQGKGKRFGSKCAPMRMPITMTSVSTQPDVTEPRACCSGRRMLRKALYAAPSMSWTSATHSCMRPICEHRRTSRAKINGREGSVKYPQQQARRLLLV